MNVPGFIAAVACILVAAHSDAAQPRSYLATEIDAKLTALRDELTARTMPRDEIRAKFDELRGLIATMPTKQELESQLGALRQALSGQNQVGDDRFSKLSQETAELKNKIPTFPAWVSPLVAVVGVLISAAVARHIANSNRTHTDVQRTEDKALSFIQDLNTAYDKIGRVLGFLGQPNGLSTADNLNQLRSVGNLYNSIGVSWRNGDASARILSNEQINLAAKAFWEALHTASRNLGKPPDLEELIQGWDGIEWLANKA